MQKLSILQKKALYSVLQGENVLICGPAGTGKSLLVKLIRKFLPRKHPNSCLYVTASTGIAAINIGGMTLHSFAGVGLAQKSGNDLIKKVKRHREASHRWKSVDVLVIDEISMISCELFEKIEFVARTIRENDNPFGGIQLVLLGDFFQLTPIIDKPRKDKKVFCFESDIWGECVPTIINLTKIFRQTDMEFQSLLNRLRVGNHTVNDVYKIKSRVQFESENVKKSIIKLHPTNKQVFEENMNKLKEINEISIDYSVTFRGDKDLKKDLELQFRQSNMNTISLKRGARVMLTVNLDTSAGLCNGTLGTIVDFRRGLPKVKFDNGEILVIEKNIWEREIKVKDKKITLDFLLDGNGDSSSLNLLRCRRQRSKGGRYPPVQSTGSGVFSPIPDDNEWVIKKATATQIPLILAWSISIHRSQGLTFDSAIISLSKCFAYHQVYVALSRVRTLDGIYLDGGFLAQKIKINPRVKSYFGN